MIVRNVAAALPGERDFRRVDIRVQRGKIESIHEAGSAEPGSANEETLDGQGLMAFPGAIDPHVHFDEPGFTHREDFLHGSAEAARGGVTTVIDMPCTSMPPVTSPKALEEKLAIVRDSALVDFAFYGGIHGAMQAEEIPSVVEKLTPMVVGFKSYFISGMDSFPAVDELQFAAAAKACAAAGRPLLLHAEDPDVVAESEKDLAATRGPHRPEWKDYYASRPMEAEIAAVAKALKLAGQHSKYLHIVHVGTARAAKAVADKGATCETCAHYLAFDESDYSRLGAALKTAPPVKSPEQKALLWHQLACGQINFVTSDHAGAPGSEKFTDNPFTAYGGIPGTGTLFPYLLSEGLFAKRLTLDRFLEVTSGCAARRYGLWQGKGSLIPGKDADFVLVDPKRTSCLSAETMFSKNTITPFAGMRLAGQIEGTFVRGDCVYASARMAAALHAPLRATLSNEAGAICPSPGFGKFLTWGYR